MRARPRGRVLATTRIPDGIGSLAALHAVLADHADDPASVVAGIETDRGLLVGALVAAGYQVAGVNPLAASRYRERHTTSRAKSDPGDARVLADLVRTDRHHHRPIAGDSPTVEAVKVLARAHQALVWTRQRQVNQFRNALRGTTPARWSVRHRPGQPRRRCRPGGGADPHPGPRARRGRP